MRPQTTPLKEETVESTNPSLFQKTSRVTTKVLKSINESQLSFMELQQIFTLKQQIGRSKGLKQEEKKVNNGYSFQVSRNHLLHYSVNLESMLIHPEDKENRYTMKYKVNIEQGLEVDFSEYWEIMLTRWWVGAQNYTAEGRKMQLTVFFRIFLTYWRLCSCRLDYSKTSLGLFKTLKFRMLRVSNRYDRFSKISIKPELVLNKSIHDHLIKISLKHVW